MIDTITYKIHNSKKYTLLHAAIDIFNTKNGNNKRFRIDVPEGTIPPGLQNIQEWFVNVRTGYFKVHSPNIKINLPSHNEDINIQHNTHDDTVSIEFSIPKFFYHTNIIEIIPPLGSKYYDPGDYSMTSKMNVRYAYNFIRKSIHYIIYLLTKIEIIDDRDIEVARIDICYNQIFKNIDNAMFYLEAIKKVRIPRNPNFTQYDTGVGIKSNLQYFKIYHKGCEFQKNSVGKIVNKLQQTNRKNDPIYLLTENLEKIESLGDRILRYELQSRNDFMSYVFNRKMLKHPDYMYPAKLRIVKKKLDSLFNDSDNDYLNYDFERKENKDIIIWRRKDNKTPVDTKMWDMLEKRYQTLVSLNNQYGWDFNMAKKMFRWFQKEFSKTYKFFLDTEEKRGDKCTTSALYVRNLNYYNKKGYSIIEEWETVNVKQKFSINLFQELIYYHNKYFDMFQFEELPDYSLFQKKIEEKNKQKKFLNESKIRTSTMNLIQLMLTQHGSWDAIRKTGMFSKNVVRNWQKKYEEITGIDGNAINASFINTICNDSDSMYKIAYNDYLYNDSVIHTFLDSIRKFF